jgi:hypothetical protein
LPLVPYSDADGVGNKEDPAAHVRSANIRC